MGPGGGGGGGNDLTPQQISDIIARDNKKARTINRQFDELSAKRQRVEALLDKETKAMWANTVAAENPHYLRTYSWREDNDDQILERLRPVLTPQGTVEPHIFMIDHKGDDRFQNAMEWIDQMDLIENDRETLIENLHSYGPYHPNPPP